MEGPGEFGIDRVRSLAFEVEDDEGGFLCNDALCKGVEAREFAEVSAID
jgi:hypothetical protein